MRNEYKRRAGGAVPYAAMLAGCLLMAGFAFYTGRSLFTEPAAAAYVQAAPERRAHADTYAGPDVADTVDIAPDQALAAPEPVPEPLATDDTEILFLGNSLVQGLQAANGYGNASFLCRKGISLDALRGMLDGDYLDFGLAVVEMGSNELGLWSEDDFKAGYAAVLDRLGCKAVCLSVPPVCEEKSRYGQRISNKNAALYSGWIAELCEGRDDAAYLDCAGFFGDALDPSLTGDGLHLNAAGYAGWQDWIMASLRAMPAF